MAEVASMTPNGESTTTAVPIRELPNGWRIVRLRDVTLKTQQFNPRKDPSSEFKYVDVSSVSPQSLSVQSTTLYRGAYAPSRARKRIRSGDILFATVRPSLRRVALVPPELQEQFCSTAFCVVRANTEQADPRFLFFALASDDFVRRVSSHQRGSSYPAVTDKNVLEETILLPPLDEQRTIGSILSAVQQAKGATEKVIAATRELRQSIMRHFFTYGAASPVMAENAELKETQVGRVPAHWDVTHLENIAELTSGGTPSKSRPEMWSGNIPWASPKDLKMPRLRDTKDHLSESGVERGSRLASAGTILVVIRGMILAKNVPIALVEVPMAFNQDLKAIHAGPSVNAEYLFYALSWLKGALAPEIGTSAHGTRRIGTSALARLPIPLPPWREQEEIAETLRAVDRKLETEKARGRALATLFAALLAELMTGRGHVMQTETGSV